MASEKLKHKKPLNPKLDPSYIFGFFLFCKNP